MARRPRPSRIRPTPESDTSTAPQPPGAATQEPNGTEGSDAATAPADGKPKTTVLINIDKSSQEMTVFVDGVEKYSWPVSTGRPEYATPSGNYKPTSMNEMWYSKQWDNSPMPHSIFFMKDGHAIHGTHEVKNLGKAASHGCVRLSPQNATTLYTLVKDTGMENVDVVLTGETPGGEGPRVADRPARQQYDVYPPWFAPGGQLLSAAAAAESGVACSGGAGSRTVRRAITCRVATTTIIAASALAATEPISMDEKTIDQAAMGRLAKALVFICGADHPTTVALKTAAESGSERDIKNARTLFLRLKPGDRRAALAMLAD